MLLLVTPVKPMFSTASRIIPPTVDVVLRPVNPTLMFVGEIAPTLEVALTPVGVITDVKFKVKLPTAEVACTPVIGT